MADVAMYTSPDEDPGDADREALREADPTLFAAYERLAGVPWRTGSLSPKVKEFIGIAADSAVGGMYIPGLRAHIHNALRFGAQKSEIVEVLQLASITGIHTCSMAAPILMEELRAAGIDPPDPSNARALEVRAEFEARRGYWSSLWESVVALDPEFLKAYLDYSSIPWENGALDPDVRELIYIAVNCVTTHLFADGVRVHIRNALRRGASAAQVMEVFELMSTLGVRSCFAALPILEQETTALQAGS